MHGDTADSALYQDTFRGPLVAGLRAVRKKNKTKGGKCYKSLMTVIIYNSIDFSRNARRKLITYFSHYSCNIFGP